jgi:hypothetical protein
VPDTLPPPLTPIASNGEPPAASGLRIGATIVRLPSAGSAGAGVGALTKVRLAEMYSTPVYVESTTLGMASEALPDCSKSDAY